VNYSYAPSGALTGFGSPYEVLNNVTYTPQGQVLQTNFGNWGDQLVRTDTYDQPTGRLLSVTDGLQTLSSPLDDTTYTYNDAGSITSESDAQYGVATPDNQCFTYNNLDELTAAWTDTNGVTSSTGSKTAQIQGTGSCNDTAPVAGKVTGGPAPYWDSYTYDALGDRTSETEHDTSVTSNANTVTQTLAYNGYNPSTGTNTAAATPDAVQSVTTTNASGATLGTSNYTYFPNGATQTRAGQKFTYTAAGLTASVQNTATGDTSTYTYDANGILLVQADPADNQRILYLPWGEQLTLNTTTGVVSGLRYQTSSPDGTIVLHSSTGAVYYELTNTNGTGTTEVNAATLAYSFRYFDPFGAPRGTAPSSWPDQRAYLNKPADPTTGLDLLGARQYDPTTGRFLSVDPVLESGDQRQMNGYSYTADNPVNSSDPSGELPRMPCDGAICAPPPSAGGPTIPIESDPSTGGGGGGTSSGGSGGNNAVLTSAGGGSGGSKFSSYQQFQNDVCENDVAASVCQQMATAYLTDLGVPTTWCNQVTACVQEGNGEIPGFRLPGERGVVLPRAVSPYMILGDTSTMTKNFYGLIAGDGQADTAPDIQVTKSGTATIAYTGSFQLSAGGTIGPINLGVNATVTYAETWQYSETTQTTVSNQEIQNSAAEQKKTLMPNTEAIIYQTTYDYSVPIYSFNPVTATLTPQSTATLIVPMPGTTTTFYTPPTISITT
jgi:RHS repeat-associated protein